MRCPRLVAALLATTLPWLGAGRTAIAQQAGGVPQRQAPDLPRTATVPFILDHNRMIVELELLRPDGTLRKAQAWVDTGNQNLLVGRQLAQDLGLETSGKDEQGTQVAQSWATRTPGIRLGGVPLDTGETRTKILSGTSVLPGVPAEVNLPSSALLHDHFVFDYPARRLTVARPGSSPPRGAAIPCRVNTSTGLFQIAATVDGETVQLGVDNGSAGTWVSDLLVKRWQGRHPDWAHAIGAAGSTNFFGFGFESGGVLMRLPELGIGSLTARDVGVLGLDQSLFDWYSGKTAAPVAGFIGANVLMGFRIEVDLPRGMTYWEAGPLPPPGDLDIVGLTLRPEEDRTFTVAGVVTKDGKPVVDGVQAGDTLLRIDTFDAAGATMGAVANALRGTPGAPHSLVVERAGKQINVEVRVARLP
jgi:hypothetical protein